VEIQMTVEICSRPSSRSRYLEQELLMDGLGLVR